MDIAVAVFASVFRSRIRILPIVRVYYLLPDSAAAVSKVSQYMGQPVLEYFYRDHTKLFKCAFTTAAAARQF